MISEAETVAYAGSYLFAGMFRGECISGVYTPEAGEPPQFFRRALAASIGEEDWNWRLQMNSEWMVRLMAAFRAVNPSPTLTEV
jgi:hypothetical protein